MWQGLCGDYSGDTFCWERYYGTKWYGGMVLPYHFVSRLSDGDEKSSKKRIVAVACMTANGRRLPQFAYCIGVRVACTVQLIRGAYVVQLYVY